MIKCITYSCLRDLDFVKKLHNQLKENSVNHYVSVEQREFNEMERSMTVYSRGVNNNSTNGFGFAGTKGKLSMYRSFLQFMSEGDTILDIDSDIWFNNINAVSKMACGVNEMKGFHHSNTFNKINNQDFYYFSGACKSYSYDLFKKICDTDDREHEIYSKELATNEIRTGEVYTPSEDCYFSYYSQYVAKAKKTNMAEMINFGKGTRDYNNKSFEIVC